jgi:hypothetical protein
VLLLFQASVRSVCHLVAGVIPVFALVSASGTELLTNGSLETGTWVGSYDFIDTNNATQLWTTPQLLNGWRTSNHSVWINDPTRAADADRFVWLQHSKGNATTITQDLRYYTSGDSTTSIVGGSTYQLSLDFAYFDPGDVNGTNSMQSSLQVFYRLGTDLDDADPFTDTELLMDFGSVSPWADLSGGSGLTWYNGSMTFTLPSIVGYDFMRIYIASPQDSIATPSRGVLIDHLSLSAVPEPSALLALGSLGVLSLRRRRTSR